MIRSLLLRRCRSLVRSYSTRPTTHRKRIGRDYSRRNSKNKQPDPPPLTQSQIDAAVALLPPRFTTPDLTSAIASLPDPRLSLHLLSLAASRPRSLPSPSSFALAIKKLGSARLYSDMDAAVSLARSLPLPPSEPLLNTIIYHYTEARMLSKAISAYKHALSSPDPAARPTARTYNILFAALLGRDAGANTYINYVYMDTVRLLFRQMLDAGIAPDIFILNLIVKGYATSLHLNDALRIFHQMKPVYGLEPDATTYSLLLHGLCAQGRTRNAREIWEEAKGKGLVVTAKAGNSMVCALSMAGEIKEAVDIVWEMLQMGRAADKLTCATVAEEMCRQGRVKEALALLKELLEKEVVDGRTYRQLLHGIEGDYGDEM